MFAFSLVRGLQVACSLCCLCSPSLAVWIAEKALETPDVHSLEGGTSDVHGGELLLPPWMISHPEGSEHLRGPKRPHMLNARHRSSVSAPESIETSVAPPWDGSSSPDPEVPQGIDGTATMANLLSNYRVSQPPPLNKEGKVPVAFAFRANQLMEFNHVDQSLQVEGWVRMYWWDPRLEYEGSPSLKGAASHMGWESSKDFLTIDSEKIWKPDITLYNAVELNWGELCAPSKAFIADRVGGTIKTEEALPMRWNVFWSQPCVFHSRCPAALKWYPFDNNTCGLEFSPFGDNFVEMHIAKDMVQSEISVPEFAVTVSVDDATIQKEEYTIVGKPVPWELVTIRLRLLRHGQYYILNFIGPILLLIMLTWVGFWIPLQASDRVAFNITLLLTLMAVNFITADKRPATHEDMWLDRFQTATMILVVAATFYSAFAYHWMPKDDWSEERRKKQLARLDFRERVARIVFPVIGGSYLGFLFWQLHNETKKEDYSIATYLIMVVIGVIGIGLCVTACGAEDLIQRLRGDHLDD